MFMVLGRKKHTDFVVAEQKVNLEGLVTSHRLFKETKAVTPVSRIPHT